MQVCQLWQMITLVGDVDNEGGDACVGLGEFSVSTEQFCCEPKPALINNIYFFKKGQLHINEELVHSKIETQPVTYHL